LDLVQQENLKFTFLEAVFPVIYCIKT